MKLNWSKLLFFEDKSLKKKKKIVGSNLFFYYRHRGKFFIADGICISIRKKSQGLLTSSFELKNINNAEYFLNIPFFLSGMLKYKIQGKTYGYKVNASKLLKGRFKNKK